jgi:transposase
VNVPSTAQADIFVGIDVSKDTLDLARLDQPDQPLRFENNADGIRRVVDLLRQWQPARIAIESTGKIEYPLLFALLNEHLNACHVNPQRVKEFARSTGLNAKTDTLDALLLARYAQAVGPRISSKKPENHLELDELVTCRRQLVEARTAHLNQLSRARSAFARKQLVSLIEQIDKRITLLEDQIARIIDDDDHLRFTDAVIRSFVGAGAVLSATLLAKLHELGRIDHGPLAALVGIAPFNDDSGNRKGQRHIRGGRANVRNVLYVCTIVAIRCNPTIKAKYKAFLARGKAKKVAIIACARSMLRILNAMVRDGLKYQPTTPAKA